MTFAIVNLARICLMGMYFAYLLVKAEANKPRRSRLRLSERRSKLALNLPSESRLDRKVKNK